MQIKCLRRKGRRYEIAAASNKKILAAFTEMIEKHYYRNKYKAWYSRSILKKIPSIKQKIYIQINKFIPPHFQTQQKIFPMFFLDQCPFLKQVGKDHLHFSSGQEY